MLAFLYALAGVLYINPLTVNGTWLLKSLTVTLYQTSMLKQLCLVVLETGHVASADVSSHFGLTSFLALGRHTLLFINVVSFHLTLVGDLKRKRSPFILHSFCICTPSSSLEKKIFHCQQNDQLFFCNFQLSTTSSNDSSSSNINNALPPSPKPIPLLPPFPFPIFPLPPQVFLPHEVQL